MTQEDKELLLKDLGARLLYGVNIQVYYEETGYFGETVWAVDNGEPFHVNNRRIENIKPYLRPMSSMTEEEKNEYQTFFNYDGVEYPEAYLDWLNSHHFDYRNLIEKGLALEAPEGMYKHFGDMDVVVTSVEHKNKL